MFREDVRRSKTAQGAGLAHTPPLSFPALSPFTSGLHVLPLSSRENNIMKANVCRRLSSVPRTKWNAITLDWLC